MSQHLHHDRRTKRMPSRVTGKETNEPSGAELCVPRVIFLLKTDFLLQSCMGQFFIHICLQGSNQWPHEKAWLMWRNASLWLALSCFDHRNSLVVHFGSEGCWLSSATPGLKMQFEDCFYLIVEVRRTSKREAKESHIDVDVCAPNRTSLFIRLHSFWWQKLSLLAPKSLPLNQKKKRKDAGDDWSWTPQSSSTPIPCHLIFCTQHANQKQPGLVISQGDQGFV